MRNCIVLGGVGCANSPSGAACNKHMDPRLRGDDKRTK